MYVHVTTQQVGSVLVLSAVNGVDLCFSLASTMVVTHRELTGGRPFNNHGMCTPSGPSGGNAGFTEEKTLGLKDVRGRGTQLRSDYYFAK